VYTASGVPSEGVALLARPAGATLQKMDDVSNDLESARQLMQQDPLAMRVFRVLTNRLGAAGWEVAKALNESPNATEQALRRLTQHGIVRTTESGLEGNYSLTSLGFSLKEQVFGGRFARS
jgi:hypothetical protein